MEKKNGKGHSFDNNGKLEFEGEYLNGMKWNGKGKEVYNKLEFEGEILNGKINNGKGKEYYYNGKLMYEGEYLHDEINGKGIEYYYNGNKNLKEYF